MTATRYNELSSRLKPSQEQLLAALRVQAIQGRSVLDIGCDTGQFHHRFLEEAMVVGVEFSIDDLAQAKALAQTLGHQARVTY